MSAEASVQVIEGGEALLITSARLGPRLRVPSAWLRDLCPCERCVHPTTRQRMVDALAREVAAQSAALVDELGGALEVDWSDDHHSRFSLAALAEWIAPERESPAPTWLGDELVDPMLAHEHDAILEDDAALLAWLEGIVRNGFGFVRGVPRSVETTGRLARRIAYVRQSIFGGLWSFGADLAHHDMAYTRGFIDLHTDGTYCHDAPGLQLLHCLEFRGDGGHSLLVDGFRAAQRLRRADPEAFELLRRVEVSGEYHEPGIHLRARRPVLRCDARGRLIQVSFNNGDRAPLWLGEEQTPRFFAALRTFAALLHDPVAALRFVLEPGTLLVFDNWRVLHGREAFTGTRKMCGCYLNHEDFESRLRVLRETLGGRGQEPSEDCVP